MATIRECIDREILPWARIACELGGMAPEAAIDHACRTVITAAIEQHAFARSGSEQHAFAHSVAHDVLTGAHRPSVGNARTYALNNI